MPITSYSPTTFYPNSTSEKWGCLGSLQSCSWVQGIAQQLFSPQEGGILGLSRFKLCPTFVSSLGLSLPICTKWDHNPWLDGALENRSRWLLLRLSPGLGKPHPPPGPMA